MVQVDLMRLASEASFFRPIKFNEGPFWKSKWSPMGGGHFWESTHRVAWFLDVQDRLQPLRFPDVMNMTRHTEYIRRERERREGAANNLGCLREQRSREWPRTSENQATLMEILVGGGGGGGEGGLILFTFVYVRPSCAFDHKKHYFSFFFYQILKGCGGVWFWSNFFPESKVQSGVQSRF